MGCTGSTPTMRGGPRSGAPAGGGRETGRTRRERRERGRRGGIRTLTRRKRSGPKVSIQATMQLSVTVPITIKDLSQNFGVRAQDMIKKMEALVAKIEADIGNETKAGKNQRPVLDLPESKPMLLPEK